MPSEQQKRTKIKICGLTNLEDARFAAGALADFLGFVFYKKSPRYIDPPRAGAIINWIEGPSTAGVFVNQPLDDVNLIAKQTGIDFIQLHGTESPDYCQLIEKPVIKAFHVDSGTTKEALEKLVTSYQDCVDYVLFDAKHDSKWGGTGRTFPWELVKNGKFAKPYFLSGGLSSRNVRKACSEVSPFALDLSSSVEQAPGVKDYDKLEELFDEMRDIWSLQSSGTM